MMTEPDRQPKKTIRQLREERGWTQPDLAGRLGVSQGAVSLWERGVRRPYRRTRLRLAELFGVSVEALALGAAEQVLQEPDQHGMG